ncbi:uncharacterized protein LOC115624572 isoform X2 [Scaptodrosophila lebanonensis]|uniref:Uncharacterized protein LOC115624572 isoform X2 n=1 Tax=Drosophila lebanonensis TaxID=7225 RepID=A0A6J2TJH4_DROLE|nr:uncharacterized protein LOC115624572 isoform X2 [Scaptodrosophila lebanonensis]
MPNILSHLKVVISGALCTVEDYVIMSQCAHNKAIHLAAEGTVSVTDISQIQNITIEGFPDYVKNDFKIALYAKETQRYLCFNDNWRLVGMKERGDTCYFNETIVHGYFVFRSVVDLQRRVGFTHRGKPVGPKKSVNDACYMFTKIEAEQFFHQHMLPKWRETAAILAKPAATVASSQRQRQQQQQQQQRTNGRKVSRNKNYRHKSNNQNQKLQQQQHANNGHNSSNNLSSTKQHLELERKQQQQQQQQQHQVRHHHNDPTLLARRQQHEHKQKRRLQPQQRKQQRVTASPTKHSTAQSVTATATVTATTTTAATASRPSAASRVISSSTTVASKRKGRRRKGRKGLKHSATAAAFESSSNMYSELTSSLPTAYEDADNSSSSGWFATPTATIDSFTQDGAESSSVSNMLLTTSADSVRPAMPSTSYSTTDAWSTFVTELETEASAATTTLSGSNDTDADTDLFQYEAELVDDGSEELLHTAETVEATAATNYETKAIATNSQAAATTTSTAATVSNGSSSVLPLSTTTTTATTSKTQLVLEQTPLAATLATLMYNKWHTTQRQHELTNGSSNTSTPTAATTAIMGGQTDIINHTAKFSRLPSNSNINNNESQQQQLVNSRASNKKQRQLKMRQQVPRLQVASGTAVTWHATVATTALATAAATQQQQNVAIITPHQQQQYVADKLFSIFKNINRHLNNTLTEVAPTEPTTISNAAATTVIAATATAATTKKSLRKSTQKLLATPYHQLTYVRNEAGDIDIDNLDNISVYPDLFEGELDEMQGSNNESTSSSSSSLGINSNNSRLTFVSGYLPTSATAVLPESIRIAKIKMNNERKRLQQQQQQQQQQHHHQYHRLRLHGLFA